MNHFKLNKHKKYKYTKYTDPLWIKWRLWLKNHPLEPHPHLNEPIPVVKIAFLLNYETDTVMQYIYRGRIKSIKNPKGKGSDRYLVTTEYFVDYLTMQDRKNRLHDSTPHEDVK